MSELCTDKSLITVPVKFCCNICTYNTSRKSQYERHILTAKHLNTANMPNVVHMKFVCDICDYNTSRKSQYTRHILTTKHLNAAKYLHSMVTSSKFGSNSIYKCKCGKIYKHRQSLFTHSKKCLHSGSGIKQMAMIEEKIEEKIEDPYIIMELIKQNQEFKQLIIDQNKQIIELIGKPNSSIINCNNTNSNNNFNLSFFLNETCKDAMNLTDFVNSLTLSLKDLENTGKLGYEEGISQIFINRLKEMAVNKRPIHCSDIKREKLYIKAENIWENDKEHLKQSIRNVANKNVNQIADWVKENPDSQSYINPKNYDSKKNDEYLNMVLKATGGSTKEEEEKKICKVVTTLAKYVEIDKNIL